MIHWVLHVLGIDTQQSYFYDFWSGTATQASLLFAGLAIIRRHNCHVHRCWRIARHPVGTTGIATCRRHHPDLAWHRRLTGEHVARLHRQHHP